jgi:hypothetical protein
LYHLLVQGPPDTTKPWAPEEKILLKKTSGWYTVGIKKTGFLKKKMASREIRVKTLFPVPAPFFSVVVYINGKLRGGT